MTSPRRTPALLALLTAVGLLVGAAAPRPAHAGMLISSTLSASMGYGYEFHPLHGTQAGNLMVTGGVGFLADIVRPELGVVGAYGAQQTHGHSNVKLELRPMLRIKPPLVPLYVRGIFIGLSPFDRSRTIGYGGAIGTAISLFGFGLFAEVGVLPRRVDGRTHSIVEGRAGASYRL